MCDLSGSDFRYRASEAKARKISYCDSRVSKPLQEIWVVIADEKCYELCIIVLP